MTPGSIYKNKRHHPDRVFLILRTKNVKIKGAKRLRIFGIQINENEGLQEEVTYLDSEFEPAFPMLMWAP